MLTYLFVGIGGALGAMCRVAIANLLPDYIFLSFPLQIFTVNVIGCFIMGYVVETLAFFSISNLYIKSFITTGFLGGFTTFSSFALEYGNLTEKNLNLLAIVYALLSVVIGISFFFFGMKLSKFIFNL